MTIIYPPNFIWEGRSFSEAWQSAVRFCMANGMIIKPDQESRITSRDMCSKITLYGGAIEQMINSELHPNFPTKATHCAEYVKEYTREFVDSYNKLPQDKQFVYLYMDRFINYPTNLDDKFVPLDQIKQLKLNLEKGISRQHQLTTWVPRIDMGSESPPCLQRIWLRILEDNPEETPINCEAHFDWRSRDCYGAWMSNYVGLMNMLKIEILDPLQLKVVKLVDNCNSLHIYSTDWEAASKV